MRDNRKNLIVNADDFGASNAVNRAIVDCHTKGVITSASLMVTGSAAREAAELSAALPALSIGLHWDVSGEDERRFETADVNAVRDEFARQLESFQDLLGRLPTHVDSHRHVHRFEHLLPVFCELVEPLGVPVRGDGAVAYVGGFYAQWEFLVTNLDYVSVPFLQRILREEVGPGWTEISCHPGYVSQDRRSVYAEEREVEVRTLTDPRIRTTIEDLGIRLLNYSDYALGPALQRS
jgi:predicted glycoside hydrolase/deacetylase ChbG (UPF0249 family)